MQRIFLLLTSITSAVLAIIVSLLWQEPATSTFEIDRDRAANQAELRSAEEEVSKYSGGLVKTYIDLRIAMLRTTAVMLDQKRSSLIRRISLNYAVDGASFHEASNAELNTIIADIVEADRKIASARQEADRYTGGLIRTMALVRVSTEEANMAQLRMKFYSAKYGLPMLISDQMPEQRSVAPLGKVVKDKDAL